MANSEKSTSCIYHDDPERFKWVMTDISKVLQIPASLHGRSAMCVCSCRRDVEPRMSESELFCYSLYEALSDDALMDALCPDTDGFLKTETLHFVQKALSQSNKTHEKSVFTFICLLKMALEGDFRLLEEDEGETVETIEKSTIDLYEPEEMVYSTHKTDKLEEMKESTYYNFPQPEEMKRSTHLVNTSEKCLDKSIERLSAEHWEKPHRENSFNTWKMTVPLLPNDFKEMKWQFRILAEKHQCCSIDMELGETEYETCFATTLCQPPQAGVTIRCKGKRYFADISFDLMRTAWSIYDKGKEKSKKDKERTIGYPEGINDYEDEFGDDFSDPLAVKERKCDNYVRRKLKHLHRKHPDNKIDNKERVCRSPRSRPGKLLFCDQSRFFVPHSGKHFPKPGTHNKNWRFKCWGKF